MMNDSAPAVTGYREQETSRPRWLRRALMVLGFGLAVGIVSWVITRPKAHSRPLPVADAPHVNGHHIEFSDRYAKRIGLRTDVAHQSDLVPTISVVGTVTFDPEHVARIGTRLRGLVRNLKHFEGDVVKRGELLAEIDSPELGEAQASVTMLKAQAEAARRNAERERDLAEHRLTTLKESEDANANKDTVRALLSAAQQKVSALAGASRDASDRSIGVHELVTPLSGTIVERHISKGQLVQADHTAFVVADLDYLWVELAVFERSLAQIHDGDAVELKPMGYKGEPIKGRVAHISSVLDEDTRSASIRVEVENKQRRLRPGQAVDAVIHAKGAAIQGGLSVPIAAITYVDGKPTVFVSESPTSVVASEVVLGVSSGTEQQIESGILPGQKVVVAGTFELKSELFR